MGETRDIFKMIHFGKKVACFLALTAVLLVAIEAASKWGAEPYRDGARLVRAAKREAVRNGTVKYVQGRTNVLFFGTSVMLAGIVPDQFDGLAGGTTASWNVALPASSIGAQYFQLKDYLKNNPPPDIAVVSAFTSMRSPLFPVYGLEGVSGFDEVFSYYENQPDPAILCNYLLPTRIEGDKALQRTKEMMFNPEKLKALKSRNETTISRMIQDRGYYFIRGTSMPNGVLPDDYVFPSLQQPSEGNVEEFTHTDPYETLFFDLAAEHHIRILLVQFAWPERRPHMFTHPEKAFFSLKERYPGTIFFAADGWNLKLYPNRLFADIWHLNREGAERYTREIYAEFAQVFGDGASTGTTTSRSGPMP